MNNTINIIRHLVKKLNQYRDAYYNKNQSLISDKEYDAMFDRLKALEAETGIVLSNSPTITVGYESVSCLKKVSHNHPLLSLDKTTELDEFEKYFSGHSCLLMGKLDGLTCSILYRNGNLVGAESRGNGEIGEDITHNARMFANLPLTIPFDGELIVDGECIITKDEFDKINEREHTEYKNPRNLVSGTVRQLNNEVVRNRNVKFIAWKLYRLTDKDGNDAAPRSHFDRFAMLDDFGFSIVPHKRLLYSDLCESGFQRAIDGIRDSCKEQHIPIDGIVGLFDDAEYGESLGMTSHHPRHSLAYKFYQEDNETVLTDIEWSTSRTGLVNPVAVFEPVEIDGTTVTRATLNNVSIIKELELGLGDTITVIKANQIIPRITQNLTRSGTYQLPSVCPSCGKPVEIRNDNGREMMFCVNPSCPAKIHDAIANFASREGLNIVGISDERLRSLMERGYVRTFKDLFTLNAHRESIIAIPGWGKSSFDHLMEAIENSRHCRLANVIFAIGIPSIGKTAAKMIAAHVEGIVNENGNYWNPLDHFLSLCMMSYQWSVVPGIGEPTSKAINEYIKNNVKDLLPLLEELEIETERDNAKNTSFSGKTFCITGKLLRFTNRDVLVKDIESKGGIVVSSVSAKTNYLITNDKDSGSSKNKAAQKYGTTVLTEDEYMSLS